MRDMFTSTLHELAAQDKNLMLITGDLGFGVLKPFWTDFPDQFINAGIAEQMMTGVAAGLALEGKTVITYSIGNFPTLRCIEQIRNDCAYHNANVKIVCVGGGFTYGSLGMSHHATEDIAMLRALPDVTVFAPGDKWEAQAAVRAMVAQKGTTYLRLGRGGEPIIHRKGISDYTIGKALPIKHGAQAMIFSTGSILYEAKCAAETLTAQGIDTGLASFPTVKPIDADYIRKIASAVSYIFTLEEHNIIGGFGSAVAEVVSDMLGNRACVTRIGLNDMYSSIVGTQDYLRDVYGMSAARVVEKVLTVMQKGD